MRPHTRFSLRTACFCIALAALPVSTSTAATGDEEETPTRRGCVAAQGSLARERPALTRCTVVAAFPTTIG